jgi:hypothetical protein
MHEDTDVDRSAAIPASRSIERTRELARLLDSAFTIPGTGVRIGLDAIIGLIPGGGDAVGAVLSSVIVLVALREGVPAPILWRMVANVVIDTGIGAVPLLGDLFDVAWKANTKNAELLERYAVQPRKTTARSRMLGILVVVTLVLLVAGVLTAAGFLLLRLWTWLA